MFDERDDDSSRDVSEDGVRDAVDALGGSDGSRKESRDATDRARGDLGFAHDVAEGFGVVAGGLGDVMGHVGTLAKGAGAVGEVLGVARMAGIAEDTRDLFETFEEYESLFQDGIGYLQDILGGFGPQVKFRLETSNTENRVLSTDDWKVQSVACSEGLHECYSALIKVAIQEREADPTVLLGAEAKLKIEREPLARQVLGVITRVEQGGVTDETVSYRLTVVPAFALMEQRVCSRIFQDKTAPEILDAVLTEGLGPFGRTFDASLLTGTYRKREYCVQYNESDLDFCCRLMEEEGVTFYFAHDGDKEVLTLVDLTIAEDHEKFRRLETRDRLDVPISVEGATGVESIRSFNRQSALTPTSVVVHDWNWPMGGSELVEERSTDRHGRDREQYDHVHELTFYDYGGMWYSGSDVERQASIRRQRQQQEGVRYLGSGFVMQMQPGLRFELTGHSNPELDGEYLITKVFHVNEAPADMQEDRLAKELNYHNEFECVRVDAPHVPQRKRRKPRIYGVQTAFVCGPEDERVYTDEWGRVKLWFQWDLKSRPDAGDQNVSRHTCWVRVQQTLAGQGWGSVFIPHVGMEAIVTFVNGDPDRPLVTGTVYGGENIPPYGLPDNHPISTIKTVGNNELRFNDTPGGEEVYLHAQRDLNERVERAHSMSVGAGQTISVGGSRAVTVHHNQTETIKEDQTTVIEGNRTESITKDESVTVTGCRSLDVQGGENKTTVEGLHSVTVNGDIVLEATASITLRVGSSEIIIDPKRIDVHSADGATAHFTADLQAWSNDGAQLTLNRNAEFLDQGGGIVKCAEGNVTVGSAHGGTINVTADVISTAGNSTVALKASTVEISSAGVLANGYGAGLKLQNANAELSGSVAAKINGGTGAMECSTEGVKVTAPKVDIKGGIINLN